jgi:glycosyltransferase involved in cell wall biosynthesis
MLSVFDQTYDRVEYIVIDGVSCDGTLDIIKEYESAIDYYVSEPDRGLYDAMNKGIGLASGDYVLLLNSDDRYAPDCVEKLLVGLKQSGADFVGALAYKISESGEVCGEFPSFPLDITVRFRNPLRHETLLISKVIYNRLGVYDTDFKIIADLKLILKMYLAGFRYHEVSDKLLYFRTSGASSLRHIDALVRERMVLLSQQFPFLSDEDSRLLCEERMVSDVEYRSLAERYRCHPRFLEALLAVARRHGRPVGDLPERSAPPAEQYAALADDVFEHRSFSDIRVLTLSAFGFGGAGNGSMRRIRALRRSGLDAKFVSLRFTQTNVATVQLPIFNEAGDVIPDPVIWSHFQKRVLDEVQCEPGYCSQELFSSNGSLVDYKNINAVFDAADVVHFHWMAGILDLDNIGEVLGNKPLVWTLADMHAFTGGCHYSEGCEEYLRECEQCKLLGMDSGIAHRNWQQKKEAYSKLKHLTVICPSRYLAEKASRSSLLRDKRVVFIPNPFPAQEFHARNVLVSRLKLGLATDKFYVVYGSDNNQNKRKGFDLLQESIRHYCNLYGDDSVEVLVFGSTPVDLPVATHFFGKVDSKDSLSEIYSAADVYVFTSRDDNAPLTVAESLACGTPVVGFPVGNVESIVKHRHNGYIARYLDCVDIAIGIQWVRKVTQEIGSLEMAGRCRSAILEHNDSDASAEAHTDLYRSLLAGTEPKAEVLAARIIESARPAEPCVYVVTPSYNSERFIDSTIMSVISQEGDFSIRYHVQDGGSTDGTVDKLAYWKRILTDEPNHWLRCRSVEFSYSSEPDGGMYEAISRGFDRVDADPGGLMTWINSDDVFTGGAFATAVSTFADNPDTSWIVNTVCGCAENQELLSTIPTQYPRELISHGLCDGRHWSFIQQEGTFWKAALWQAVGGLNRALKLCGDWDLWRRFAAITDPVHVLWPLGKFRIHDRQLSKSIADYYQEMDSIVPEETRMRVAGELQNRLLDRIRVIRIRNSNDPHLFYESAPLVDDYVLPRYRGRFRSVSQERRSATP